MTRAHIVTVGAGIGGIPVAYEIRELLCEGPGIAMVNATGDFQVVPRNPWVVVGWRQREEITLPIIAQFADSIKPRLFL